MKPEPLKRYRTPAYPTKLMIMRDPEILKKSMSTFRLPGTGLASALALFVAASGGCTATTGCMVVLPPVYLTEEEAMEIIRDEFASHGVNLSVDPADVSALELAVDADAVDLDHGIAVEFISKDDCVAEGGGEAEDEYCDFDAVKAEQESLVAHENPEVHFEAFSDPAQGNEEHSEQLLREQVRIFAEWLQSEGVI
ncbi:MAG: hypothetical protein JXR96_28150 [Deltaproteobacteria bacterium]|nr:hypothetical protein [Deltaproteobacteria bacterium]